MIQLKLHWWIRSCSLCDKTILMKKYLVCLAKSQERVKGQTPQPDTSPAPPQVKD